MATPVKMDLLGIDIRTREQMLEITQHFGGDLPRATFRKQQTPFFFSQGCVTGENVVFLFVTRLVLDYPIRNYDVGKPVAWAPGVIAFVEYWFAENQIDHRVRNIA